MRVVHSLLLYCVLLQQVVAFSPLPGLIQQTKPAGGHWNLLSLTPVACTVTVYNESWQIINQGSGFFFSPNLLLSSRHVFWKADMQNAHYAKVTTYSKQSVDYNILSVIIDDADSDLIILSVEGSHYQISFSQFKV